MLQFLVTRLLFISPHSCGKNRLTNDHGTVTQDFLWIEAICLWSQRMCYIAIELRTPPPPKKKYQAGNRYSERRVTALITRYLSDWLMWTGWVLLEGPRGWGWGWGTGLWSWSIILINFEQYTPSVDTMGWVSVCSICVLQKLLLFGCAHHPLKSVISAWNQGASCEYGLLARELR